MTRNLLSSGNEGSDITYGAATFSTSGSTTSSFHRKRQSLFIDDFSPVSPQTSCTVYGRLVNLASAGHNLLESLLGVILIGGRTPP
jgi:hypothetical protein